MKFERGQRRRVEFTVAKRHWDMAGGWDYFWDTSLDGGSRDQRRRMSARLRDEYAHDPDFRLCKITYEILDTGDRRR